MADESQSYQYLQLQSKDEKAILFGSLELKLPSEIRAEQLRPISDRVILALGAVVFLLGLISMLGFFSLPGLSSWSSPLGIFFLGIALSTTLTDHNGDKPAWYSVYNSRTN